MGRMVGSANGPTRSNQTSRYSCPGRSRRSRPVSVSRCAFGSGAPMGNPQCGVYSTPVEAGLLVSEDWDARFVTPDREEDTTSPQPCPMLRREFEVHEGVRRARLYVTSLGVYEVQLNGTLVGDHVLAPGWTSYHNRLRYQTFDVTDLLREGPQHHRCHTGRWLVSRATWASMVGGATSTVIG